MIQLAMYIYITGPYYHMTIVCATAIKIVQFFVTQYIYDNGICRDAQYPDFGAQDYDCECWISNDCNKEGAYHAHNKWVK